MGCFINLIVSRSYSCVARSFPCVRELRFARCAHKSGIVLGQQTWIWVASSWCLIVQNHPCLKTVFLISLHLLFVLCLCAMLFKQLIVIQLNLPVVCNNFCPYSALTATRTRSHQLVHCQSPALLHGEESREHVQRIWSCYLYKDTTQARWH